MVEKLLIENLKSSPIQKLGPCIQKKIFFFALMGYLFLRFWVAFGSYFALMGYSHVFTLTNIASEDCSRSDQIE